MIRPRSRSLLLLAALLAWLPAADEPPPVTPAATAPAAPTVPATPPAPATPTALAGPTVPAAELLSQLPKVPAIVERDGGVWWQDGVNAFRIIAVDVGREGAAVLDTPIGKLAAGRKLITDASPKPAGLAALPNLVERAKAAQLKGEDLQLTEGIITGIHLRSAELLVHTDGVLRKSAEPAPDRRGDRERVAAAVERLVRALPATKLDELGRKCLEDTLRRLPREDAGEDLEDVPPSFARRAVRHGWLRPFFPEDPEAIAALEKIVAEAERFLPTTRFTGDKLQLAEVKDAFNRGGWIISTPSRSAYTTAHSEPLYYWALGNPKPMVVVDLPPGTDPTTIEPKAIGARMYQNGNLLAEWKDGRLRPDLRPAWRSSIPAKSHKGIDTNAVTDFLPPHIVVAGLNGDIAQLLTEGGALVPPRDGTPAESERFLTDAAKVLADPARLDLLGEYILKYVHDSPDSRFPALMGSKTIKGDIHQTTRETLSTVVGGMVRGDCDDLAEVYETIADLQGRSAQVISLPRHAAAAFAEKKDDGAWHAYVLQTGPPLEFADPNLPGALEKAFKSFDEGTPFDANGLGVLLRFSGENTRGQWRLSWRIFQEPDYAKTMIDVQRDWQYQTYQRGISKVRKLIEEKNDQDNANYRELSGLYSFTGQYAKAVEMQQEAIKRTPDANGRLQLAIELVMHQFDAKQEAAARATALDILDKQLPALRQQPGEKERAEAAQVMLGLELAGALAHGKAWDLALRTIKETQLDKLAAVINDVGLWLASPRFNQKQWDNAPQLDQMRRQMAMFCATGISVIEGAGPRELRRNGDLRALAKAIEGWLANVAFHDIDDEDDALARYAMAGNYYAAMQGTDAFNLLLAQAEPPAEGKAEHAERLAGPAQVQLDLPWIAISVPFWSGQLLELFARDRTELKKEQVALLGKRSAAAFAACRKLGIDSNRFESQAHLTALITALVHRDAEVVRERLRWVKSKNDKRLRDDTAQWLGDTARFLDKDWFGEVLALWRDEVDYKPKYFWIAWRAALNGAPEHALMAAKLAAERFKDDPSFAEEYAFMKQLFTPQPR